MKHFEENIYNANEIFWNWQAAATGIFLLQTYNASLRNWRCAVENEFIDWFIAESSNINLTTEIWILNVCMIANLDWTRYPTNMVNKSDLHASIHLSFTCCNPIFSVLEVVLKKSYLFLEKKRRNSRSCGNSQKCFINLSEMLHTNIVAYVKTSSVFLVIKIHTTRNVFFFRN